VEQGMSVEEYDRRMARFHLDATEILERVMFRRHYSPLVREQIIERLERITARELAPKIRETAKAMQTEIERDIKKKLKKKLNLSSTRGAGSVA
jgi:flagellar basal body-associated protein FliL